MKLLIRSAVAAKLGTSVLERVENPEANAYGAQRGIAVVPVSFQGHLGALYRPAASRRRGVAVVVCAPIGRDGRSLYRPLHLWAERLAQGGFDVLRFDPRGEGDSLPLAPQADQWRAWRAGVSRAAAFARAYTGAPDLVLCGVRSGAMLALSAAARARADGVILFAPVLTGESWLRDVRLTAMVQGAPDGGDGALEVDGLRLSRATMASLRRVDVHRVKRTWRSAFLAAARPSRELLALLGPGATIVPLEAQAAMLKDAHVNAPPWDAFDAAGAWLMDFATTTPPPEAPTDPSPAELSTSEWRDVPIGFGAGLRGVLCLPRKSPGRQGVIIGNTAADPRAGIGAFATRAARALAARGVAVLRMDFAGMGESASVGNDWRTHVYEAARLADFQAAAQVLRARGFDEITLLGVCTGGFHAVEAVLESTDFERALAINSWIVWRPERMPLEMRSEMAQGGERLRRLREGAARTLKSVAATAVADPACRRVRERFRSRAGRGPMRIHLLFGRADVAMRWLEPDFGPNGAWLDRQPGVTVAVRAGLDHALFSEASQANALKEIFEFLGVARAPGAEPDCDRAALQAAGLREVSSGSGAR